VRWTASRRQTDGTVALPVPFVPENELEQAMVAAATSADARPLFYEVLRASQLLVVNEGERSGPPGSHVLEAGMALTLRQLDIEGVPHTPVFSSPTRVSAFFRQGAQYMSLAALDLFEIVRGAHVILNPGSDFGKQFTPDEIAGIQDMSIFAPRSREVVQEARQVLLGQPSDYPHHITGPLSSFFAKKKAVRAAYLAHMHDPKSGVAPHTLIGVEVDAGADYDRLMGEVALVMDGTAKKDEIVDFIRIDRDGGEQGLSSYMTGETKPFYRRRWLGIF
jgi:hypothetical protein